MCNLDPCPYCGPHKPKLETSPLCDTTGWNDDVEARWIKECNDKEWNKLISKKTSFKPKWVDDYPELEDMPNVGFAYDPTHGADDVVRSIIDEIEWRSSEPLQDVSLRDDEVKGAILSNTKKLLLEAAQRLSDEGY